MRKITDHIVEGDSVNNQLDIEVQGEPGPGGANHDYMIWWEAKARSGEKFKTPLQIIFQNGPIKEVGVNGVTHEALLAIVIDRLRSFQKGPFACEHNAAALSRCESALWNLQARTHERIERGVEGTNQK